jgi:hypothetical protein
MSLKKTFRKLTSTVKNTAKDAAGVGRKVQGVADTLRKVIGGAVTGMGSEDAGDQLKDLFKKKVKSVTNGLVDGDEFLPQFSPA